MWRCFCGVRFCCCVLLTLLGVSLPCRRCCINLVQHGSLLPFLLVTLLLSLLWFWLAVTVAVQAHFDLYMTSAPVGHHVPLQPLVTGPHLHPSPASAPPSSSSPSTLPSSSQSSVTGPPCFSFFYPLFPHDFLLVKKKAPSVSASLFPPLTLHPCLFCLQCVSFFSFLCLYIISLNKCDTSITCS